MDPPPLSLDKGFTTRRESKMAKKGSYRWEGEEARRRADKAASADEIREALADPGDGTCPACRVEAKEATS